MTEFKPNTTQYPNFLFDLMPTLKEGELRLLNAIVRKTYGWQKQKDRISISQMIELTGMSKQGILDARERLINKNIIKAEIVNGIMEYMVVIPDVNEMDVNKKEGVNLEQMSSLNQAQMDVHQVDIQKKELQNKNTKEREREESHTKLPDKDPFDADTLPQKPIITIDGTPYIEEIAEWIIQKFHDYYRKEFNTSAGDLKKQDACKLYSLLISDDKEQELDQIILMYEYSWHGTKCQQTERAKYPMKPTPTRIIANWDKLSVTNIPYWIRDGHETETAWKTARQQRLDTEKEARHKAEIGIKPYNAMEDPLMIEQLAELEKMKLSFT